MKSYPIVCPSCKGTGLISPGTATSDSSMITCPACKGTKIVTCFDYSDKEGYKFTLSPMQQMPYDYKVTM